jgi:nitroreductase
MSLHFFRSPTRNEPAVGSHLIPVDEADLDGMLEVTSQAPSAENPQPWDSPSFRTTMRA